MQTEHIVELLDERGLQDLGAAELSAAEAHAARCADCDAALRARRLSSAILSARSTASIEPSPYFATRVMARIREQRGKEDELGLASLWKAAWGLVTAMALVVAILTGASVATGTREPQEPEMTAARTMYSPAWDAIATTAGPGDELSDEQIVGVLYESEVADEQ